MTNLGICLAVLRTTCCLTERGEEIWGGGVQGRVICWIIICGVTDLGDLGDTGGGVETGERARICDVSIGVSCKQGLSGSCGSWCIRVVWPGPGDTA